MNPTNRTRYIFPELYSPSHTDHVANLEQALFVSQRELAQYKETQRLYNEIIFAVACKFENETRHQTELRDIFDSETHVGGTADAKGDPL